MSLIAGSLAVGLIVAGGVVFVEQLLHWTREREWRTVTLRSLGFDDLGNSFLPGLRWLRESHDAWYTLVVQFMDAIPLWMFLVVIGGMLAVRAGKVRS
jgi:glucose-6-phosphate-specific signal transduction histidine kinase